MDKDKDNMMASWHVIILVVRTMTSMSSVLNMLNEEAVSALYWFASRFNVMDDLETLSFPEWLCLWSGFCTYPAQFYCREHSHLTPE